MPAACSDDDTQTPEVTPDDGRRRPPGTPEYWFQGSKTILKLGRTDHSVIGVARARGPLEDWYDLRAGILSRVKLSEGAYIRGGYFARGFNALGGGHQTEHRIFGGPVIDLWWDKPHARYLGLVERFIGRPNSEAFTRHRHRLDIEKQRLGYTPFVYEELFMLGANLIRSRTRAGLRYKVSDGRRLDLAYQFEWMKVDQRWGPRHSVVLIYSRGVPIDDY